MLSREDVFAKIDGLLEVGGDLVGFNGGFNPKLPLDYYCDLFAAVRERYGDRVEFYALTIAEFVYLADRAGLSHADAAARLRDAGVHWVTGGGSEILTEDFRKRHAKFKYTVARVLRGAARDRRVRDADDRDDGDRLRRDAGGAARAPAADARLPGRDRRPLLLPLLDVQAVRDRLRRARDLAAGVLAPHRALADLPRQRQARPHVGADPERGGVSRARLRRRRLRPADRGRGDAEGGRDDRARSRGPARRSRAGSATASSTGAPSGRPRSSRLRCRSPHAVRPAHARAARAPARCAGAHGRGGGRAPGPAPRLPSRSARPRLSHRRRAAGRPGRRAPAQHLDLDVRPRDGAPASAPRTRRCRQAGSPSR